VVKQATFEFYIGKEENDHKKFINFDGILSQSQMNSHIAKTSDQLRAAEEGSNVFSRKHDIYILCIPYSRHANLCKKWEGTSQKLQKSTAITEFLIPVLYTLLVHCKGRTEVPKQAKSK